MGGQYAGMGGQHDPEWGVSIVRNLQLATSLQPLA